MSDCKKVIHIHQQKLRKGEPPIIVRTYRGSPKHYSRVDVLGPASIVSFPEPDTCGARAWIETNSEVIGHVDGATYNCFGEIIQYPNDG